VAKSQQDGADKYGRHALLGLHKALRAIARKKAAADADAGVAADVIAAAEDPDEVARREARLRIACVLGHSVNHLHLCAPMAAWSLLYGSRFLTSEAFSVANLNEAMSWVNGGDLAYSLAHLADTGGADADILTPSCNTDDYAWRGTVLADLSLYEFSMLYRLCVCVCVPPRACTQKINAGRHATDVIKRVMAACSTREDKVNPPCAAVVAPGSIHHEPIIRGFLRFAK
jgi:hypothetical protein